MKRSTSKACQGSSQGDVLEYLEQHDTWLTTKQIADGLGLDSREKVAKFLKSMEGFFGIERRRIVGSNQLEYRITPTQEK